MSTEDQSSLDIESECQASNFAEKYGRCREECLKRHLRSFLSGKRLEGILGACESAPPGDNVVDVVLSTLTGQKLDSKPPIKLHPEDKAISQLSRANYSEFKTRMTRCEYTCAEKNLNLLEY